MKRSWITLAAVFLLFYFTMPASASDIVVSKHIIAAPAPIDQPPGAVTPDGTFNVRDPGAPFHSDRLADAMWLDRDGRNIHGDYLDLNHAVYTAYRLSEETEAPTTILVLMPGTWAGAMSMDSFARDLLRTAEREGASGLEVWLVDRRSEQLEDHTGLLWAEQNKSTLPASEIIQGMSDYYKPAFLPGEGGRELLGRRFTPLDHDAVRFMANWGADAAIRDWRAVVLEAHRRVGSEVSGGGVDQAMVIKKPGRHVFIGGHSLGGSLTVLYASYDFDRSPERELPGMNDVDGLVLLEGGSPKSRKPETRGAASYRRSLEDKFEDGKVYFDMDMLGIRYAPSTMLTVGIAAWAADNARGMESIFPEYSRPRVVRLPRATNEAVLAFAVDDDLSPFFIARASIGLPDGEFGLNRQLRSKTINVPLDPNDCGILTPWRPGHKAMDPDFLYGWNNIDQPPYHPWYFKSGKNKCRRDEDENPEVTEFYAFARALYGGASGYVEAPWLSSGPNDFPEWYFPPRLSTDSGMTGARVVDEDLGVELFNGSAADRLALPVISFTGDDSMGEFSTPEFSEKDFAPGVLAKPATQVHLMRGCTHLDIAAATRNNQPDLADEYEDFNGCAVYAFFFMHEAGR